MDKGIYSKRHPASFNRIREYGYEDNRNISRNDSYRIVLEYVVELDEIARNGGKFEKDLIKEIDYLKKKFSEEKGRPRLLENLISYRSYQENVDFYIFLENLKGKNSVYDFFSYLTDEGNLGDYKLRLDKLYEKEFTYNKD